MAPCLLRGKMQRPRRICLLTFASIACLSFAVPASAQDVDCEDFPTQEEAQQYFLDHGGPDQDPNGFDPDDDGIACEFLPSAAQATSTPDPTDDPDDDDDADDPSDADDDDEPRNTPRAPRTPRPPGGSSGSGGSGSSGGGKTLPITGGQAAAFGGSALALLLVGFSMMSLGSSNKEQEPEATGDAPRWGDDPLIGW